MFDSIRNWFGRSDRHQADARELEAEAKQFKLPGETMPQVFKYVFMAGLALLNYRLFAHAVPGVWGQATGCVAMIGEAIALYCLHYFSRAAGWFRGSLGLFGGLLMLFSLVHGTFSILDLMRLASISATVRDYSRFVAFPLLAGLVGLAVVAITMTHPKNVVRLKQALAHMRVVIGRAEAASEMELMRAQRVVEYARLDRVKERSRNEAEYLVEVQKIIGIEQRKRAMVAQISDPALREAVARELGLESAPSADQWPPDSGDQGKGLRH